MLPRKKIERVSLIIKKKNVLQEKNLSVIYLYIKCKHVSFFLLSET